MVFLLLTRHDFVLDDIQNEPKQPQEGNYQPRSSNVMEVNGQNSYNMPTSAKRKISPPSRWLDLSAINTRCRRHRHHIPSRLRRLVNVGVHRGGILS